LTPNELVLTFRGSYVCANFGENRSRNATVRVPTDGQTHTRTHTHTDANRFYNLPHAICYSYGTDKKGICNLIRIFITSSRPRPRLRTWLTDLVWDRSSHKNKVSGNVTATHQRLPENGF